ncbi:MAG: Flp pilus assembly complex ATPase component TadA [Phycisphaerales bacterium]|nr:Flp pilus assembly complex ATPase component TadA [Phycisphaerales bacterium]
MAKRRQRIGEILVGWEVITKENLADALEYARSHNKRLGEAAIELELTDEETVTKALASQFDMEYVDLDRHTVTQESIALLPEDIIRSHMILPMGREDGRLKIIITDPLDLETLDLLRFRLNTELSLALAPPGRVKEYIEKFVNPMTDEMSKTVASIDQDAPDLDVDAEALEDAEDADAPIIRLINLVIREAVRGRASDIHIEPMANRVLVRYRIDGVCHVRDEVPKNMQNAVTTRLKIMAGLDIAEKRVPQDGRIKMKLSGNQVDFRVSACPAYHGESIVLRILRPESANVGIAALGLEDEDNQTFQRIIRRPNGIFLVTGPTGSGKTTTLYSALQELNRPDKKIITAEDPVEYNFTGINQCQVKEDIGLTFARILRSMLRQAPNIILVGEIRDKEVGEVAIQAALTGHLVFSTLHTNDAPSAIARLIDMGIKPFLVASAIQAIMAQRLVRCICKECRIVDPQPDKRTLRLIGFKPGELEGKSIYKGAGCARCGNSGYRGRQGIFEIMTMNNELRELAFNRAPTSDLRKAAASTGMKTLVVDGRRKILAGITSPDELLRITQAEGIVESFADE